MAHDRAFRFNSFGISATIAFAFVMPNSRYLVKFKLLEYSKKLNLLLISIKLSIVNFITKH
ncbi:hypothetical protein LEP1GSC072_0102 [Leptospira noguchii str. Bonito]|nr:hypothetical protein LEP1GSC072_0102 [Leptospira noguchii str. Bonito]